MSSQNLNTSWANRVKMWGVIPWNLHDKFLDLINTEEHWLFMDCILRDYGESNNWQWQAGFNGRSSGYIVMYKGHVKKKRIFTFEDREDMDYADGYGWKTREEAEELGLLDKEIARTRVSTVTVDGDFEDYDLDSLRETVARVQKFDKMCDEVVSATIKTLKEFNVVDEEYTVVKTRKVLEEIT